MKIKFLLTTLLIIFLTSCGRVDGPHNQFRSELENASPDFQEGWKDGCNTGMYSGGNTFYNMFSQANKQDGYKIANSPDYKTAWNYAFWYCYREEYVDMKSSIYGSFFRGHH